MPVSRRTFIKITGAGLGAAAVGSLGTGLFASPPRSPDPGTDGDRVVPTFCEICFWKCGVLAHVKAGRVTKIEGNPKHPLSRGRLCPRGVGGAGLLYDPDRLKTPLLRRAGRGEDRFEPVSWDTALDFIAERMRRIADEHGPEAMAMFTHGWGGSWFRQLMAAYGSASVAQPSFAQCRGARDVGLELTFGSSVGSPETFDLPESRVITLIGSHLGENMHNTQVQDLAEALGRGAELVVVDPRFSIAAGKARYWLPIKPGTDLALLLAWIHVILEEGRHDREYLERYAIGLEALTEHVRPFTPEWAAVATGLAPGLIAETARFIAGARPASLIHPGRRVNWYGDDVQRTRAIGILNALLGSWGRRGGIYLPTRLAVPSPRDVAPPTHTPRPAPDHPLDRTFPFATNVLAHGLRDASLPGAEADYPYAIKGWLVYGTNLLLAMPERDKTIAALQSLDLVVAIDVLPAEITGWADVILPECTYLERYDDLYNPPYREGFVALRQPVVEPMYDSKPGWWIARELGARLGLAEHLREAPEPYLDARLRGVGASLEELARDGVLVAPPEPITLDEGLEPVFDTPSGKIELYSQQLADAGLDPLPVYRPPADGPPGSFRLLVGRAPVHTFGRTTNNRLLSSVYDENCVWVNAERAAELGLASGDRVLVTNQDGATTGPLPVRATQAIRRDCAYMVHGFGHRAAGLTFAHGRGADDATLCTQVAIDPAMGGTGINVNFITLSRLTA